MGLSIEDRFKDLIPGRLYYPYKIAKEMRRGEPELAILRELVPAGCTAIDVGANRGYYSYALSKVAGRVEAFEPNPALARFARRKLAANVRVHEVALTDHLGRAKFYLPQTTAGIDSHLVGNLHNLYPTLCNVEYDVAVATVDSFDFDSVGFIKIDVEGGELLVIKGALQTVARWKPNLLVELLVAWHDAEAKIAEISSLLDYSASIVIDGRRVCARQALEQGRRATIKSYNVVFTPRPVG